MEMDQYMTSIVSVPMIVRLDLEGNVIWAHGVTGGKMDSCTGIDYETTNKTISASFSNDKEVIFLRVAYEHGEHLQSTSISFTKENFKTFGLRIVGSSLYIAGSG